MSARLAGHGLFNEGWPYIAKKIQARHRTDVGMAKCQCGAMSEMLPSLAARKRWRVEHKIKVRFPL